VALDDGVCLGVPVANDALRAGEPANAPPGRVVRGRNGEAAAFEIGVLVILLLTVLGVPFA
jgi:hypothetical protein